MGFIKSLLQAVYVHQKLLCYDASRKQINGSYYIQSVNQSINQSIILLINDSQVDYSRTVNEKEGHSRYAVNCLNNSK